MSKVRTQLYLDGRQKEFLDERAQRTGKSMGQLVREALDEVYFKTPAERPLSASDPLWNYVGAGESRQTDVSVRHDDYLIDAS